MKRKVRFTARPVIAPVVGAVSAFLLVPLAGWDQIATSLLVILSVATAAIMVRLARPLPFTNPAPFEPEELADIGKAMLQIAKALRLLVYICLLTMAAVVIIPKPSLPASTAPLLMEVSQRFGSATIGALVAFVLARLSQVVESDISLINLQSELLQRSSRRAKGKREADAMQPADAPIAGATTFGKSLHS